MLGLVTSRAAKLVEEADAVCVLGDPDGPRAAAVLTGAVAQQILLLIGHGISSPRVPSACSQYRPYTPGSPWS
jgi:hypothetical protein